MHDRKVQRQNTPDRNDGEFLRWLHLSDIHMGHEGSATHWASLEANFLDSVIEQGKMLGAPDLVLITGDIANTGSAEEYEKFDVFLDRLSNRISKELGADAPLIIPVPGNHDLFRPKGKAAWPYHIFSNDPTDLGNNQIRELHDIIWGSGDQSFIESLFPGYLNWLNKSIIPRLKREGVEVQRSPFPGDLHVRINLEGRPELTVVGLNSAWMQYDGSDYKGRLALFREQIGKAAPDLHSLNGSNAILMMHHPLNWFSKTTQADFHEFIYPANRPPFLACLSGHLHEPKCRAEGVNENHLRSFLHAPSLFGLEKYGTKEEERAMGYAWGQLDAHGGILFWPLNFKVRSDGARSFGFDDNFQDSHLGVLLRKGKATPPTKPKPSAARPARDKTGPAITTGTFHEIAQALAEKSAIGQKEPAPLPAQAAEDTDTGPMLIDLVRASYDENIDRKLGLTDLVEARYASMRCTVLQKNLLDALKKSPPGLNTDILLCGGTSSGKTFAAEILFGLANGPDFSASRILYIAPTRALAQERWRDWSQLFKNCNPPGWRENVILSTGEDHSHDGALRRGEFLIACIVYEKANVLLSTSPQLLKNINMVVVDELHMISDYHRGPILETLLAKISNEKSRRHMVSRDASALRVVGITTETKTAEAFAGYFESSSREKPLVVSQVGRPVAVEHVLVECINDQSKPYRQTKIATFNTQSSLSLNRGQRLDLELRMGATHLASTNQRPKDRERQVAFLLDWIERYPYGRRLLVFIGSKHEQISLASTLRKKISQLPSLNGRQMNRSLTELHSQISADDSSSATPVLGKCISRGLFIHSADVSRPVRASFETYLSRPLPDTDGSEIIFATETLSYGVNLAIDDVSLFSADFPASDRNQEYGASPTRLTHCAFGNMCGRAGRLNQSNENPKVYVWAITNSQTGALHLIRKLYDSDEGTTSQVIHRQDIEGYKRALKNRAAGRAPLLLTYPLVRTVLDGLRFVGGAPGAPVINRAPGVGSQHMATSDAINTQFCEHLLYWHENESNADGQEILSNCVKMILEDAKDFELVNPSGNGFRISELGSSIIDTGTEISTLAPLKASLDRLVSALSDANASIPVEALLLPIMVQNEAHRQVFSRMPEIRSEVAGTENRKAMLDWIRSKFDSIGFTQEVVDGIDAFLKDSDENPTHAQCTDRETPATPIVHDACLRIFCGLLLWVSGHSISDIHAELRTVGRIPGPADINTNFKFLAERISWKVMFLGNLMRFSRNMDGKRMLQTKARRLIVRLRLGCQEHALPFLVRERPGEAGIGRQLAHKLLSRGATAKTICSGEFDVEEVAVGLTHQVQIQVQDFIRSSFSRLKDEFIFRSGFDDTDEITRDYWQTAEEIVSALTHGQGHSAVAWPIFDRSTTYGGRHAASEHPSAPPSPSITITEDSGALKIVAEKIKWEDDSPKADSSTKWYVQFAFRDQPLQTPPAGYTNVLIDFPWLLEAAPNNSAAIRMSPAAFGILLTLISRYFLVDPVEALESVLLSTGSISSLTLLELLYSQLTWAQLPEPLFEAWAAYWDAE